MTASSMIWRWRMACAAPIVLAAACSEPQTPEAPASAPVQPGKEIASVAETQTEHKYTNRLVDATSPYLLQHAHNPVDWYPWATEALDKAKKEDKPIFLSVGYSACHWCHVMERESFESEEVAEILNEHFVSIKVDREERPDIDEIYMTAVQAMTGSGGWPMSVFLTPDLKPFYGGTYFPPEPKFGRPGFKQILHAVADAWENKRGEILESAEKLTTHMDSLLAGSVDGASPITEDLIAKAVDGLASTFDDTYGGFGQAPKFPNSPAIQLLLREYRRTGDEKLLHMATLTLDKMAHGGMYDHLGGGFARYSVDGQWLVPHFEKMLYDNAQLAQVYLEAFQITGDPYYRQKVEETFAYVLRDMRDERGGFYSAEDADSDGQEGKFYIWSYDEIVEALGEEDAKIASAYYSVKPGGNFPSHEDYHRRMNILHTPRPDEAVAEDLGMSVDELRDKIAEIDQKLFDVRSQRVRPGLDDKVLTSWNALMISALAQGHQILNEDRYRDAAVEAAEFILNEMTEDGHLLRTYRAGESHIPAYLDDYAFFIVALVDLYEATFDVKWLEEANRLAQLMIAEFWDEEYPGFYFTSDDHKNLIVRSRTSQDSAVPSGGSMAALGLLRLAKFLDKPEYHDKAQALLEANYRYLDEIPRGFLKMLVAADYLVHSPKEIAVAGPWDAEETQSLLHAVHTHFVPNKILAWYDPASDRAETLQQTIPLLEGRTLVDGAPAAYVCENFVCQRPVSTTEELLDQLGVKDKQ